jgi:hypothetical protein
LGTAWCCQNLGNFVDVEICAESLEFVSSKLLSKLDLENFIASGTLTSVLQYIGQTWSPRFELEVSARTTETTGIAYLLHLLLLRHGSRLLVYFCGVYGARAASNAPGNSQIEEFSPLHLSQIEVI